MSVSRFASSCSFISNSDDCLSYLVAYSFTAASVNSVPEYTMETKMYISWKKYQVFSPIAEVLLDEIKNKFDIVSSVDNI